RHFFKREVENVILLQLDDVSKSFGAEQILSNIKLEIKENERIAIVGRNGAGKSTLLKIIANEMSHDSGQIFKPKDLTTGYLDQHTAIESSKTIWEEMLTVFTHLIDQEKKLRTLEEQLKDISDVSESESKQLLHEYDELQQSFVTNGGYQYESDIQAV